LFVVAQVRVVSDRRLVRPGDPSGVTAWVLQADPALSLVRFLTDNTNATIS
jgi:hypothetical protein